MTTKQKFLLVAIILLAVFFRFYKIAVMPGGLFPDEAANGLDVNYMQRGDLQPFYERGNGREALFFYMEWAATAVFGKNQWAFHVTSAFIGVLSVLMVYFVAYRLFLLDAGPPNENYQDGEYRRKKTRAIRIGLLAAFLMAVSSWHVVLSRTALRANLTPLFGALVLYFLLRTYQESQRRDGSRPIPTKALPFAALTGAAFGLGFYTYIAFRVMLPVLGMLILWPWLAQIKYHKFWSSAKQYWQPFAALLSSFMVFVAWIAVYFIHNPVSFTGRGGQVSIFNQTLYTVNGIQLTGRPPLLIVLSVFWQVAKTAVVGFFANGDLNWRQNISGYPFLSPLISPFFGVALIVIAVLGIWYFFAPNKRAGWWKYYLLTGWFWGMLLPEMATAEGIPHGLRSAGAIAPTFIICAVGLYVFAEYVLKFHRRLWKRIGPGENEPVWAQDSAFTPWRRRLADFALKFLVWCFVAALVLQTYFLYFGYAAASPEYFYSFRADLTPVSQYLVQRCQQSVAARHGSTKNNTFLVLDTYSEQTPDYLTSDPKGDLNAPCNVPYIVQDPASSWQLPPLEPGQEVVFTQSTIYDTTKFTQHHPEARLYIELRNQFDQAVMAVYRTN